MSAPSSKSPRRLFRSRRDKVIGGVCGGLGGYFNVDPVVIRVVWLALILFGGTGLLAYIIAWILIPDAPDEEKDPGRIERSNDGGRLVGVVLIILALIWIGSMLNLYYFDADMWKWLGPLGLVALGVALLLRRGVHDAADRHDSAVSTQPAAPPPAASSPPAPFEGPPPTDAEPVTPVPGGRGPESSENQPVAGEAEPYETVSKQDASTEQAPEKPRAGEATPPATVPEKEGGPTPEEPSAGEKGSDDDSGTDTDGDDEDPRRPFERGSLHRSGSDKVIAGVCGGLARYLNADSTLVRLGFALITLASVGAGVLAYIAIWLLTDEAEL